MSDAHGGGEGVPRLGHTVTDTHILTLPRLKTKQRKFTRHDIFGQGNTTFKPLNETFETDLVLQTDCWVH